jgi:hypothetical protein
MAREDKSPHERIRFLCPFPILIPTLADSKARFWLYPPASDSLPDLAPRAITGPNSHREFSALQFEGLDYP